MGNAMEIPSSFQSEDYFEEDDAEIQKVISQSSISSPPKDDDFKKEEEEKKLVFHTKSQHSFKYCLKGLKACTPISISISCGFLGLNEEIFDCITSFEARKALYRFFQLQTKKLIPELANARDVDHLREILLLKWIKRGVETKGFSTFHKRTATKDQKDFIKKLNLRIEDEKFAVLDEENELYNHLQTFEEQFETLIFKEHKDENFCVILTANKHTTALVARKNVLIYFDSSKSEGILKKVSEMIVTNKSSWKDVVSVMKKRWSKAKQCDFTPLFITRNGKMR